MAASKKNITPKVSVKRSNGGAQVSGINITNITIRPVERTNQDIQKWRNAHQEAEGMLGTRISIYDLYDDVLLDGFLSRQLKRRISSVVSSNVIYADASGAKIDGVETLLKSMAFREMRKKIQEQKAWGHSLIELSNQNGKLHIFPIPRKHVRPIEGIITSDQYSIIEGIEYRKAPYSNFVLEVGEWDDLGYLLQAAPYVIYKRGGIADWANYAQIFGLPFREARYDGFNDQVRIQLEQAMEKAGSAAYAVLPKEAEIIFHEAKNASGSTDLFNTLRTAMNEEIAVLVLGATETTTSSSSSGYAQSETHMKTVLEVYEDDRTEELCILNENVAPILQYIGLLPEGGHFAYDDPMNLDEADKKAKIGLSIKKGGVPVADDWFYQTTGIPKPDNYDELKAEQEANKEAEQEAEPVEPKRRAAPTGQKPAKKPAKAPPAAKDKKKGEKLSAEGEELAKAVEQATAKYLDRLNEMAEKLNDFFTPAPLD